MRSTTAHLTSLASLAPPHAASLLAAWSLLVSSSARRALPRWALAASTLALLAACEAPPRCADGLCPVGMRCNAASGQCVDDEAAQPSVVPTIAGAWSIIGRPGLRHAIAAYVPSRHSLAFVERDGGAHALAYIAGEAAGDTLPPGKSVAAAVDAAGTPHLAWVRPADASLWHAERNGGGWQRKRIEPLGARKPADRLALALWNGRPAVAFEDDLSGGVAVAHAGATGVFQVQDVPLPDPVGGKPVRVGGTIAAAAGAGTLTVAFYDVIGGDLIVASRGAAWVSTRLAGRATDGSDDGDVGHPCAAARDLKGSIVVAYRDRTRNRVMLARSLAGAIEHRVVSDGSYVADGGLIRRRIVGTALDVTALANGRLAIAWQDASRARIGLAIEDAGGNLQTLEVPAGLQPQLRPKLLPRVDGSLLVGWLELEPSGDGGRVASWVWAPTGGGP